MPQTGYYQMKHLIISGLGNFLNHLFYVYSMEDIRITPLKHFGMNLQKPL